MAETADLIEVNGLAKYFPGRGGFPGRGPGERGRDARPSDAGKSDVEKRLDKIEKTLEQLRKEMGKK